jgi:hypothetical protein
MFIYLVAREFFVKMFYFIFVFRNYLYFAEIQRNVKLSFLNLTDIKSLRANALDSGMEFHSSKCERMGRRVLMRYKM